MRDRPVARAQCRRPPAKRSPRRLESVARDRPRAKGLSRSLRLRCLVTKVLVFDRAITDNQTGWRSGGELCWRATRQGITNRKLIETMSEGVAAKSRPLAFPLIGLIDFLMPQKTHAWLTINSD